MADEKPTNYQSSRLMVVWEGAKQRASQDLAHLLGELLRPSSIERLLRAVPRVGRVPLPPGVPVAEAVGEPEIPELRARSRSSRRGRLPVRRPAILLLRQHAALPILLDRLDLEVFEDVHPAARAQLKDKGAVD